MNCVDCKFQVVFYIYIVYFWLQLAKKWHPDVNKGNAGAEKKFQEIQQAYEVCEQVVWQMRLGVFMKQLNRGSFRLYCANWIEM